MTVVATAPSPADAAGTATALDRSGSAPAAPDRRSAALVLVAGIALATVLAVALTVGGGRSTGVTASLAQAGPLVDWGVPAAHLVTRIAALGTVGALLFAAVLRPGAVLPAASRRAVRAASVWATVWAAAEAVHALLTLTQLVGTSVSGSALRTFLVGLAAGRAALVVLAASVLVAVMARRTTTSGRAAVLLVVALAGLVVPTVLTGHSAAADHHLLAVTNLSVHVVAASLWVGGLLALLLHGRDPADTAPAATRFSAVALGCFLATGSSGVLAAWFVLGGTDGLVAALDTGYGWLLLAKTAALVGLGAFGWHHRRRTLPRLHAGRRRSFRRFAAVEAAVMLATVALAVALAASPPPAAGATSAAQPAPSAQVAGPAAQPAADPMAGHDHGELSVSVLIDETRFHVSGPVDAGSRVTVHNATTTEVTITASDGTFDVVVPGRSLITFEAPAEPGSYPFGSRHSSTFADVLIVG